MTKAIFDLAEKIKTLREKLGITQAELARRLGITRSSVNGWEMGLSVPSTPILVELSQTFNVSVDYLLGLKHEKVIHVDSLSPKEVAVLVELVNCFEESRNAK